MKKIFTLQPATFCALLACLATSPGIAQLNVAATNTAYTITFDATMAGVSNGAFDGSGFQAAPATGQLDSDAWASTGLSDGALTFGGTQTSGDHARGTSTGGVGTGGFYAFNPSAIGSSTFGIQPGSSDWASGTLTLRVQNTSGSTLTSLDVAYALWVNNDEGRSNSLNFSWSTDDVTYTSIAGLDYTSPASADALGFVVNNKSTALTGLSLANNGYIYLRWSGDDVGGSGSRDEFALDDISVTGHAGTSTSVEFASTASTAAENGGTVNLVLSITDPDALNATSVTIGATDPNGRITSFTSPVIFPAGSSADENITVTLNDNALCDGDEGITFTITGISGGQGSPFVGANNAHTLTVTNDELLVDPTATAATGVLSTGFTAHWDAVPGATGYFLDVSTSPTFGTSVAATGLLISEYVEGSGSNKYIEIYNGTGAAVDLSAYTLNLYSNGNTTPTNSEALSGMLANDATAVYANSSASIYGGAVTTTSVCNFNGDDAVALLETVTGNYMDIFGTIGEDPAGGAWTSGTIETEEQTLVRKNSVTGGITTNPGAGFPTLGTEWDSYAQDDATHLGAHAYNGFVPDYVTGYENLNVGNVTQLAVTGLNPGTTYYYRVRSVGGCSSGLNSNVISVITLLPGCTDPLADNYNAGATSDDGSCTYCAPTITYNAPTPTPITIGSGIPDQNMAVSQDCRGIDVALNAFERFVGPIIPVDSTYTTTTGNSPTSSSDPTPDPVMARWNLLGSVDLGTFDFTDVNVFLDLDFDPAASPVWNTVNLSQQMIANSMGGLHVYQASENLAAPFWTLVFPGVTFDPDVPGIYDVRVRLESAHSNEPLVNMAIQVVVELPEITYYSQASGNVTDAIWDVVPVGTAGAAVWGTHANMVVQNGHTVTNTADVDVRDLNVNTGGALALNAATTLTVNGDSALFDGTLNAAGTSTLALAGADATLLESAGGALSPWNLTMNTPAGTSTDATINIRGTLQLNGGDFDASLANVTLASAASGTGRLGPVASGASYTGNITVQRYIPAGHTNWRMLASPVAGQTVDNWQDDFLTAGYPGSPYPNFDDPVGSGILWPSVRWYDETNTFALADSGVVGVIANTQALSMGQGFLAWSGDDFFTTFAFTVDVTGSPNIAQSPVTLPMSHTSTGTAAADGWNLVANPLPSPIDFTAISRGADVPNSYWIFDPVAGTNRAWTNGVGQGGLNGVIQSSQAFWLKADGPNLTTTLDENAKVEQSGGGTFGGDQDPLLPILNLSIASSINTYNDLATIVFDQGSPAFDAIDARKMTFSTIGAPQIGVVSSDDQQLAIDFFGSYASAIQIPLTVDVDLTGTYTISAAMAGINNLSCISLTDLQTGTVTPLTDGAAYSFTINAEDPASGRFLINGTAPIPFYNEAALCHGQEGTATVVVDEGPVDITWTDVFGNVISQLADISDAVVELSLLPGDYQVHITPGGACGELVTDFTITAPDAIGADVLQTATSCPNSADGSVEIAAVTGGTAPYSVLWSNGASTNSITGAAGNYTGIITDAAGCVGDSIFAVIPAGEGTIAEFNTGGGTLVVDEPVAFTNTSVFSDDYLWDFGDGTTSTEATPEHTYALPGTYTVTLTATGGDCSDSFTLEITVEATSAITPVEGGGTLAVWATPDHLVIDHPFGNAPVDVDVYDATGRLAISRKAISQAERITLNDRSLNTALWFVRVKSGDVLRTFRVPIVR